MKPLIDTFGKEKRWVNWKFETVGGKLTKIPYYSKTKKSSSTDSSTWKTYEKAELDLDNGSNKFNGIGIVFTSDQNLLGIDIDHCLVEKLVVHEQKSVIERFIQEADTYTEISPSKTGLHLFLHVTKPLQLTSNKKAPFEVYTSGRYFTVTGDVYEQEKNVRTVTPEEALRLLSIIGYPWNKEVSINSTTEKFTDNVVLEKMFSARNGSEVKALYNGDTSANKGDESSADLSLVGSLAFWTGRNASQIERIWLASPLGSREKTQKRKDYRDRTIQKAISECKDVYTPMDIDLLYTYNKDKEKVYIQNTENVYRILKNHPQFQGRFRLDIFKNKEEIFDNSEWREIKETDSIRLQTNLSILFTFLHRVSKEMVRDAISKVSEENSIHPPREYMTSLRWDGTKRIDIWLNSAYGAPKDDYHRAVGANWLKGLVKRIVEPGCKFDYVLVLQGAQGIKKSTSLAKLVGEKWHLEMTDTPDHKDFFEKMRGKIVIEFSEGETLTKSDVKKMKAVITMQSDTYRPSYGHYSIDFPRQCVFAMTTNEEEFLKDDTGNRRWLPVSCNQKANVEWIEANRDQLFAEAYHRVINLKESTWEFPEEETRKEQEARRIKDPNTDIIVEWYNALDEETQRKGVTTFRIYKEVLNNNMPSRAINSYEQKQIGTVLRLALNLEPRQVSVNSSRVTRWFKKGIETPLFLSEELAAETW